MPALPIIIDCDPGQDDAINLLLAMSSPADLHILGVTTVAGNVPLRFTEKNARLVCDIAGRDDIPVFAGCSRPLQRELITAEAVHGEVGLEGIEVIAPKQPLQETHAVDFITETLRDENGLVTLVLTGPLTNIATAIQQEPSVVPKIAEIVLMGGAMREAGNYSPSAEFNILVDPHAAQIVFQCGRPITTLGLDVTHQVTVTPEFTASLETIKNNAGHTVAQIVDALIRRDIPRYSATGFPLHDPCTIAFLLNRQLFRGKQCNLTVETTSELTMGHTAVDFWNVSGRPKNVNWIHTVDPPGFFELLLTRLGQFGGP